MNKTKENKFKILLLTKNYLHCKRSIREAQENIIPLSKDAYIEKLRIVTHIENVAECLEERHRLIIENEVLNGKTGKWYLEFLSAPTYYRHRCKAYEEFLRSL